MNSTEVLCAKCQHPLDIESGGYADCVLCEHARLCPRCAIGLDGPPLCPTCEDNQRTELGRLEQRAEATHPCRICGSKYESRICAFCFKWVCERCDSDTTKHTCRRCATPECTGRRAHVCCDQCWCGKCYVVHWGRCPNTQYYYCIHCKSKVLKFGAPTALCPASEACPRRWGCTTCQVRGRNPESNLWCDHHIATLPCRGCGERYPTLEQGWIIMRRRAPPTIRIPHCGWCMDRMRAFIECALIWLRRTGKVRPKEVMDKIITLAIPLLTNSDELQRRWEEEPD